MMITSNVHNFDTNELQSLLTVRDCDVDYAHTKYAKSNYCYRIKLLAGILCHHQYTVHQGINFQNLIMIFKCL